MSIIVRPGTTVTFVFTLTVDGQQLASVDPERPIQAKYGTGYDTYPSVKLRSTPGLIASMNNRHGGDEYDLDVAPADGYGEFVPDRQQTLSQADFELACPYEREMPLFEGMPVRVYDADGQNPVDAYVVSFVEGQQVTLDFNHYLAGKTLHYHVQILKVRDFNSSEWKLWGNKVAIQNRRPPAR